MPSTQSPISLADIAAVLGPSRKKITLRDGLEVEIMGLSGSVIASLLRRFPEDMGRAIDQAREAPPREIIEAAVANPGSNPEVERFLERARKGMVLSSEKLFPAIIAAGIGRPGDETEEAFAATFPVALMSLMVDEIMRLSYAEQPNRPFVPPAVSESEELKGMLAPPQLEDSALALNGRDPATL